MRERVVELSARHEMGRGLQTDQPVGFRPRPFDCPRWPHRDGEQDTGCPGLANRSETGKRRRPVVDDDEDRLPPEVEWGRSPR
jgi:hypothetical protein